MTHDYSPWSDGWGGDTNPVTCCFSAAGIGGLWPGGIVWRLA